MKLEQYNLNSLACILPIRLNCPNCSSLSYKKHGKHNGIQRYRCKKCGRTFKSTHDTPFHGIHKKNQAEKYLYALYHRMTIREAAKFVGISIGTAFRWRHRFLAAIETDVQQHYGKIQAVSYIKLPFSNKGQRINRNDKQQFSENIFITQDENIRIYKLEKKPSSAEIFSHLTYNRKENTTIAFRKSRKLTACIKKYGACLQKIKDKEIEELLLSGAEEFELRIYTWLDKYKGVATKYLQSYWNWFSVQNQAELVRDSFGQFKCKCTANRNYADYKRLFADWQ